MNFSTRGRPLTALFMAVVMTMASLPLGAVHAGMISTETIIKQQSADEAASAADRSAEAQSSRDRIHALLARDDVRAEMIGLGIAPAEAEARLAALTDEEVADIAGRLDQLPAGEGIGTILVILFIVFGVAVLLDALGMIDIFPFVCGSGQCGNTVQAYYPEPAAPPPANEPYLYEEQRAPAYRRDQFDRYDGRRPPPSGYESNQYYEPQPQAPVRNYYQERYGTQRYVR